jgi:hypothetical protein
MLPSSRSQVMMVNDDDDNNDSYDDIDNDYRM